MLIAFSVLRHCDDSIICFSALLMQPLMFLKSILMQGYNIFDDIPPHADELYGVLKKWAEEVSIYIRIVTRFGILANRSRPGINKTDF